MKPYWAIYYDNGTIFTSLDGTWAEAPVDGVVFVLEFATGKTITHSGQDYYICDNGKNNITPSEFQEGVDETTIFSTGDLGPYLRKSGAIKFGRWCSHKTYEKISAIVAEDAKRWQQ